MARCCVLFVLIGICGRLWGQKGVNPTSKPNIDIHMLGTWPKVASVRISPYGRYVGYSIEHGSYRKVSFVIEDTARGWKREFNDVRDCTFSSDERLAIFQQGDSLHFLSLGSDQDRVVIINTLSQPKGNPGEWIAYAEKGSKKEITLVNLLTGKERRINDASKCIFDKEGKIFLVEGESHKDSTVVPDLRYVKLDDDRTGTIWTGHPGEKIGYTNFDDEERQMVFTTAEKGGQAHSLWHYGFFGEQATLLFRTTDAHIDTGLSIQGLPAFSKDGKWIFFNLAAPLNRIRPSPPPDAVKVDIWSYKDRHVQPDQLVEFQFTTAVISATGKTFRQLKSVEDDMVIGPDDIVGDLAVIARQDTMQPSEDRPVMDYRYSYYLVDLRDGSRRLIRRSAGFERDLEGVCFSPDEKWMVYYDKVQGSYYSYDVVTGRIYDIGEGLPAHGTRGYSSDDIYEHEAGPVAGWLKGGEGVLLYSNYDLWSVDLRHARPPIDLTGGYGIAHRVMLRLVGEQGNAFLGEPSNTLYSPGDILLFTGFNVVNKYNGFYRTRLGAAGWPEKLTMGPYTYYRTPSQMPHKYTFDDAMAPMKALKANCWVVKRQSAEEAPNYFITEDLKHFRPLSALAPQAGYNWLTSELVTYRQLDGTYSQGVLYKPENFDPSKKYPVLFNYYEVLSHRVYEFPMPELSTANIDIPWFVSQGYLVFTPDIHYETGSSSGKPPGFWVSNSVVAAAECLAKLSYVDGKRMGIQGHSFGGGETTYLVTHTHLFAAAAEAAGGSDPISGYLTLVPFIVPTEHDETEIGFENEQPRYGATPWQHPELYREESAVLHADRVTTPLLIMHNKLDNNVQWRQGVELYMALRRLGKKVWMLQYDNEKHVLLQEKDALDYTIRLTQFFAYYLKGALPPVWMTEGIPAKLKGFETGYELDRSGKIP